MSLVKVAIKKDKAFSNEGIHLVDNFHFTIMPRKIGTESSEDLWEKMGYTIVEVTQEVFEDLCKGFGEMINFQLKVNMIFNNLENKDEHSIDNSTRK